MDADREVVLTEEEVAILEEMRDKLRKTAGM
jgi:hypothetical protein